jgi:hypothetical protein
MPFSTAIVEAARQRWREYGLSTLIGLIGLAAAIWATWLNLSTAWASGGMQGADQVGANASATEVDLPVFAPQSSEASLSRQPNLYTEFPQRPRVEVIRYTVQPGDSIFGIANAFNIKPETVLLGNYAVLNDNPHMLKTGLELNILPMDGAYYQWKEGDIIGLVARVYGVEEKEILDWVGNDLDPVNPQIEPGKWLMIPGGARALSPWIVPTIARGSAGVGSTLGPGGCTGTYSGAVGTGSFIWPCSQHIISGNDYWSGHLAIDIAVGIGEPVWAADSGVVVFAGWSYGGYGNIVMIDHGNGWQTLYAHLNGVGVGCGQSVSKGQTIGWGGSTGNSTGPHLHFETRSGGGFVNPWYVLP